MSNRAISAVLHDLAAEFRKLLNEAKKRVEA